MKVGWLARTAVLGGLVLMGGSALAEELNDKVVDWLMIHAFAMLPDKFTGPDQKVIKIDHTKPDDFFVPRESARAIIKVAYDSARAQTCHLPDKQRDNYQAMIKHEQDAAKWNEKQMLYIKQLHLFVVQFSTGTIKLTQVGDSQKVEAVPLSETITKIKPCTDEEKKALTERIDAYVKG